MESEQHALMMQEKIREITTELNIPFIFKTSFDKANRTSVNSKRGLGLAEALFVFKKLSKQTPVITDIHESWQASMVAVDVDVLQIPAFLCRQTDLLIEAGKTGRIVNVKKGQFVSPDDMKNVVKKIESTGNNNIMLTERGTFFGYNNLVVDFRSLKIMSDIGYPVVMDATHSVQRPGGMGESSGGDRQYVELMAKAGLTVGISALFLEVHDNPEQALSDAATQFPLHMLKDFLIRMKKIDQIIKEQYVI